MAQNKSDSKSSPLPQGERDNLRAAKVDLDLEFPDGTGFQSKYVRVGLEAMVSLCEDRLELFNSRPDAEERRLRDKCNVEFVL